MSRDIDHEYPHGYVGEFEAVRPVSRTAPTPTDHFVVSTNEASSSWNPATQQITFTHHRPASQYSQTLVKGTKCSLESTESSMKPTLPGTQQPLAFPICTDVKPYTTSWSYPHDDGPNVTERMMQQTGELRNPIFSSSMSSLGSPAGHVSSDVSRRLHWPHGIDTLKAPSRFPGTTSGSVTNESAAFSVQPQIDSTVVSSLESTLREVIQDNTTANETIIGLQNTIRRQKMQLMVLQQSNRDSNCGTTGKTDPDLTEMEHMLTHVCKELHESQQRCVQLSGKVDMYTLRGWRTGEVDMNASDSPQAPNTLKVDTCTNQVTTRIGSDVTQLCRYLSQIIRTLRPLSQLGAELGDGVEADMTLAEKLATTIMWDAHNLRIAFYSQVEATHRNEVERDEAQHRLLILQRMYRKRGPLTPSTTNLSSYHGLVSAETAPTNVLVEALAVRVAEFESVYRTEINRAEMNLREALHMRELELRRLVQPRAIWCHLLSAALIQEYRTDSGGNCVAQVAVRELQEDGPADICGMMEGDIITSIERNAVSSLDDYSRLMQHLVRAHTRSDFAAPSQAPIPSAFRNLRLTCVIIRQNASITLRITIPHDVGEVTRSRLNPSKRSGAPVISPTARMAGVAGHRQVGTPVTTPRRVTSTSNSQKSSSATTPLRSRVAAAVRRRGGNLSHARNTPVGNTRSLANALNGMGPSADDAPYHAYTRRSNSSSNSSRNMSHRARLRPEDQEETSFRVFHEALDEIHLLRRDLAMGPPVKQPHHVNTLAGRDDPSHLEWEHRLHVIENDPYHLEDVYTFARPTLASMHAAPTLRVEQEAHEDS